MKTHTSEDPTCWLVDSLPNTKQSSCKCLKKEEFYAEIGVNGSWRYNRQGMELQ